MFLFISLKAVKRHKTLSLRLIHFECLEISECLFDSKLIKLFIYVVEKGTLLKRYWENNNPFNLNFVLRNGCCQI